MASFSGSSALEVLRRLSADDLAAGFVNIIDVSAIRDHSPDRWERRRPQVETFMERLFRKRARDTDSIIPLSAAQFLVIQPGMPRVLAMACCGHTARETLTHFLGAESMAAMKLLVVRAIADGVLQTMALDESAVLDAMAAPRTGNGQAVAGTLAGPDWRPIDMPARPPKRVVVQLSPRVEALLSLDPIWSVQQGAVVSFLVGAAIFAEAGGEIAPMKPGELDPQPMLALALQMTDYAVETLAAASAAGNRFCIHLPVGVDVLSRSRERLQLIARMQRLEPADRAMIVLELDGCSAGMPQSRMLELVSVVKPHCRAVVARIADGLPRPAIWRDCGLSGTAMVSDGTEALSERQLMHGLRRFAAAAAGPRSFVIGHGLRRRGLVLSAWAEGFTHISGQVISDEARTGGQAVRLSPADVFAASAPVHAG